MKKFPGAPTVLGLAVVVAAQSVSAQQGTFDRSKPPELGPPPRVSLPPIVTRQLPNGLKLLIVEQHELPLADFVLVVGSGSTADPTGKPGVANLTSQMLREGTTTRKSLEIADQIAFLESISRRTAAGNRAPYRFTHRPRSWTALWRFSPMLRCTLHFQRASSSG